MKQACALVMVCLLLSGLPLHAKGEMPQVDIAYMKDWPLLPSPFGTRDWADTAKEVTLLALDEQIRLPFFPATRYLTREQPSNGGFTGEYFLTRSYLNDSAGEGEAVTQLAAVLTLSLLDSLDARDLCGRDYVRMAQAYFSRTPDGRGFVSNNLFGEDCADSYWYTLYPTLLYFHLASLYPEDAVFDKHLRAIADTWLDALSFIDTWDAQGVSLKDRVTVQGTHAEPEGAFGAAYVLLIAYEKYGDAAYLEAARRLMEDMAAYPGNPYYEILGSYAPYIAARMNAQHNAGLPLGRMMDWVFTDGALASRTDWGMMNARWGEHDAYGLSGSLSDLSRGYAFAMNTFVTAGALAPVARYAPEYSKAIGRYLLAAAVNSQMFLADGLPPEMQDDGDYAEQTGVSSLVYEGLRHRSQSVPFATGDIKAYSPSGTNFSFYSSGPIGMLYTMLRNTDVPEILCVDLLKTDFWHGPAYPTYLMYNPLDETRQVSLDAGAVPVDIYDAVTGEYIRRNVTGKASLEISGDTAVQAVLIPAGLPLTIEGNRITANHVPVAYRSGFADMPDVTEGMLIRQDTRLSFTLQLPEGDRVIRAILTWDGKTLLDSPELPADLPLPVTQMGTGLGLLKLSVRTASGRELSCIKRIGLVSPASPILEAFDAADLYALVKPGSNYSAALTQQGLQLKLDWGSLSWDCPSLTLRKADHPFILVSVPYATGRWGLQCLLDGTEQYIRADSSATGEFLIDMEELLAKTDGEEVEFILRLYANGNRDEVVFQGIQIIKGAE